MKEDAPLKEDKSLRNELLRLVKGKPPASSRESDGKRTMLKLRLGGAVPGLKSK